MLVGTLFKRQIELQSGNTRYGIHIYARRLYPKGTNRWRFGNLFGQVGTIAHPIRNESGRGSVRTWRLFRTRFINDCRNEDPTVPWHISAAIYEIAIMIILENFQENSKFPGNFI